MEFVIKNSFSIIIALLSIGLEEAIIKPVLKKIFQRKIIKYAPAAMKFLDEQMPVLINEKNAKEINTMLKDTLKLITEKPWSEKEINELFRIYDPRITAERQKP